MGIGVQEYQKLSSMTKVTKNFPSVSIPLTVFDPITAHAPINAQSNNLVI